MIVSDPLTGRVMPSGARPVSAYPKGPTAVRYADDVARLPVWIRSRTVRVGDCATWTGPTTGRDGLQCRAWDPQQRHAVTVSRRAYELAHGVTVPGWQVVVRKCGNGRCVRPDHLGTADRGEHRPTLILGVAAGDRP
ncbi:hypothetical protein [Flexivirga sp. B27]